jgi:Fe-S-cluster-containing dehydrogenase component
MTRYAMVIDLARCIGCDNCSIACKARNATPRGVLWNHVLKYETGIYPDSCIHYLPMHCMHCAEPECEKVCPTGAITKREDGIVVIDSDKCMGCRYCILACPYASPHAVDALCTYYENSMTPFEEGGFRRHKAGVSGKCDFCVDRVEQGLNPACVTACVAGARFFGDLDDPQSEVSGLIRARENFVLSPELDTEPSCYYLSEERSEEKDEPS